MSLVEADGRVVERGRDPPGQRSHYIPPGDQCSEVYRLTTFVKFPDYVPTNPCVLAKHGFYYTGYKDRVMCFRCGQTVENWMVGDDPSWERWHDQDCGLVTGRDTDNIPIERNRFQQTPHRNQHQHEEPLPSQPEFQQMESPRNLTPTHQEQTQSSGGDVPSEGENDVTSLFPCLEPVNPHMRERNARLQTFTDNLRNWPSHRINSTPDQMADAGLYYLGERDRVKCWYCNGGLQNWDRFDDPWFEHAKWFPSCEFLLLKKGPAYIHNVVSQYPNINRPTPVNASRSLDLPQVQSNENPSSGRSNVPVIIDPREDIRRLEGRVEEEMRTSQFVEEAKVMGFSEEQIRFAIMKRFEEHDSPYESFTSLVDYIITNQDTIPRQRSAAATSQLHNSHPEELDDGNVQSVVNQLERLKEQRSCKVCNNAPANVVLLPCGHLASCGDCSKELKQCPLCQATVQEVLKSYIV